jgi:hypothetical protein
VQLLGAAGRERRQKQRRCPRLADSVVFDSDARRCAGAGISL